MNIDDIIETENTEMWYCPKCGKFIDDKNSIQVSVGKTEEDYTVELWCSDCAKKYEVIL